MKKFFISVAVLFAMISCNEETEIGKFVLTNKNKTYSILSGTKYYLVWMDIETHEKFVYHTYNGDTYFKYDVGDTIAFEANKKAHFIRVE